MSSPIWALWYQFSVQTSLSGQFLTSCLAASSSVQLQPYSRVLFMHGIQCSPPGMQLSPTSVPSWNPGLHCSLWWPGSWMPLCCLSFYPSLSYVFFRVLWDRQCTPVQAFQHLLFAIKWGGGKCHLTRMRILRKNQYYQADLQLPADLPACLFIIHYTPPGREFCLALCSRSNHQQMFKKEMGGKTHSERHKKPIFCSFSRLWNACETRVDDMPKWE